MEKIVIGTFGYCGSGQDTFADGLCERMGFVKYGLGDIIREEATRMGLSHSRKDLQNTRMRLDTEKGRDYIPKALVARILASSDEKIVFTGVRRMEEYRLFRDALGMKLIYIYADRDIRYQRMLKRGEPKDGKTIEEIETQMRREQELFDYPHLENVTDYIFDFGMPLEVYQSNQETILMDVLKNVFQQQTEKG